MRNSSRLILNCSLVISTLSIHLSTGTRLAAASAFRNISDPTGGDYACAPVIFREKVKHIFKVEIHDIDLSVLPELQIFKINDCYAVALGGIVMINSLRKILRQSRITILCGTIPYKPCLE